MTSVDALVEPKANIGTDHRPTRIRELVNHAAHLLPAQGPITAFVHHNTLHAFEDLEFDEAVRKGARLFGCHPYLTETKFRELLVAGRIRPKDIDTILLEQLGDRGEDMLGFLGTRFHLFRAILNFPLHDGPQENLRWVISEKRALDQFREDTPVEFKQQFVADTRQWIMRDWRNGEQPRHSKSVEENTQHSDTEYAPELSETIKELLNGFGQRNIERWSDKKWESLTLHLLWKICEFGTRQVNSDLESGLKGLRPRNWLLELCGQDCDELVNETLIRFCSAFIDQGFAHWPLPDRDKGLFKCFISLLSQPTFAAKPWMKGLASELKKLDRNQTAATESISESLEAFGIDPCEAEQFIGATLLALPGFAGMLWQLETRGDRVSRAMPEGTLLEFIAVRLLLDRFAVSHVAQSHANYSGKLDGLKLFVEGTLDRTRKRQSSQLRTTFRVFEIAQLLGWRPRVLAGLRHFEWEMVIRELASFSGIERRQIYHLAYERKIQNEILDAVATHSTRTKALAEKTEPNSKRPLFQLFCCIDEREESFRRHLEEVEPDCETLAFAGFYAIPMYYRGAADAHFTPLCPVSIVPSHYVREEVVYTLKEKESKRKNVRRTIGTVTHRVHVGSRTFTGGWIGATLLGTLATFPLVARTLFPRTTARFRGLLGDLVKPPEATRLRLERTAVEPGPHDEGLGFTVEEMAQFVATVLKATGLTRNFARLVVMTGHGSSSLNNPHEAAHDCGACAGARGGPNARAISEMANDPRVRKLLSEQGVEIPDDTVFIGSYHNTCDDSVSWFDLDRVPTTHQSEFENASNAIDRARRMSAHERCRRFESAPLNLSFDDALKHVEGRAEDLSQVRPEYGHATNAVTLVGRREWSRGLFLDRRAFLQSYDPKQDDKDGSILAGILSAVIPVCAGIALEYYFSFVDPTGYGCGTKLPHNITGLVGVMNGAASDLRTGLPWQMVEIHEPVRQLFIIETTPYVMNQIMKNNESIRRLCKGNWVQVALLDEETSRLQIYRNGEFVPYQVESKDLEMAPTSVDWYRGWRDHLAFASIGEAFRNLDENVADG